MTTLIPKHKINSPGCNTHVDKSILVALGCGGTQGWEMLYDAYGSMLYGIFYRSYGGTAPAEAAFIKCFLSFQDKKAGILLEPSLSTFLIRHTYAFIRDHTGQTVSIPKLNLM